MSELKENEEIKYIICDPSCSGSGMNLHLNSQSDSGCTLNIKTPEDQLSRVQNLSKFQYKILSHALDYCDSVKYVSYSTCSIYREEDE
jgi:putative methyltransferase